MAWRTWVIDSNTRELIGPCGCRVPGTAEGLKQAQNHVCEKSKDEETD